MTLYLGKQETIVEVCRRELPEERRTSIAKIQLLVRSRFLLIDHCVDERVFWRWCIRRVFKFSAKVTKNVFIPTMFYSRKGKIHCNLHIGDEEGMHIIEAW